MTTLQIRPIISSLEGPLYKLSWFLAQILKAFLPTFSGHDKNSDEVIHRLTQLNTEQLKQNNYTFSLDVISLYTTVPAHPAIDIKAYNLQELILSQTNSNRYTSTIIHYSRQYILHLQ